MIADPEEFLIEDFEEATPINEQSNDGEEPTDYEAELLAWKQAPELWRTLAERTGYLNALRAAAGYEPIDE